MTLICSTPFGHRGNYRFRLAAAQDRPAPSKRDNRKHTIKTASMKRKYKNGGM